MSTRNLRLQGPRKLQDRFVGPFKVIKRIGQTAYKLDLEGGRHRQALRGVHDVFHVSLLRPYDDNGLGTTVPAIEVDGEQEFEVSAILKHRVVRGEDQYLTSFTGFDASENMWLNEG